MPQANYMPLFRAMYPLTAPFQKPGGVSIGTSVTSTGVAWAAGTATVTAPFTGLAVGSQIPITLAGYTPAGWNGTYAGTVSSATTVTFPIAANPGTVTTQGTVTYVQMPANATPNPGMVEQVKN